MKFNRHDISFMHQFVVVRFYFKLIKITLKWGRFVGDFISLILFKCNGVNLLINVTLTIIEQIGMVRSAHLFNFVFVESILLFRGEPPDPTGAGGQRPWERGPWGGSP